MDKARMGEQFDFPVTALMEAYPYALPPGSLFKFRGYWALRVAHSEDKAGQAFVVLQGPNAGILLLAASGMARALTLAEGFGWFPGVAVGAHTNSASWHTASIAISQGGPVVIGGDEDGEHYAFGIDGRRRDDYSSVPAMARFDRWTAHLALKTDPLRSLGSIFSVDRRAPGEGV